MSGPKVDVLTKPRQHREALAVRQIEAAWFGCDPLVEAFRAGWTAERVIGVYGATWREIRRARAQIEAEACVSESLTQQAIGENVSAPRKVLETPTGTTCTNPSRITDRKEVPLS